MQIERTKLSLRLQTTDFLQTVALQPQTLETGVVFEVLDVTET